MEMGKWVLELTGGRGGGDGGGLGDTREGSEWTFIVKVNI